MSKRRRIQGPSQGTTPPLPARLVWVVALALALAAGALYLPTLGAEFVFDDVSQLVIDDYVHHPAHLLDVLSLRVLGDDVLDRHRPLMLLSLILDSTIWGRGPAGYHVLNILLHAACTALVFALFLGLYAGPASVPSPPAPSLAGLGGATFAALLFAVHPIASEAVSVVTFREDLLATFFLLLGVLLALRLDAAAAGARRVLVAASALSFLLAIAAKETGVAGPPLLLLAWWRCARAPDRPAWRSLLVIVWVSVSAFLVASAVLAPTESVILAPPEPIAPAYSERLRMAAQILGFYAGQIVWPVGLSADYALQTIEQVNAARMLGAFALLLVLPLLLARRSAAAWIGAALFWLALLPVSNLVPIYNPMADRYLYTPLAGLALIAGSVAALPAWSRSRARLVAAGGLAVLLFGTLAHVTLERERVWHDGRSLWSDTLTKNPISILAANGLALAFHDAGQPAEAVQLWRRAITTADQLGLEFPPSWAGLALSLDRAGRPAEADRAYRAAIDLDARYRDPHSLVRALQWRAEVADAFALIARRCCTP